MKTRQILTLAIALGTLMASTPGFTASSPVVSLSVTASVAAKCIVSSTAAVAFGAYDPIVTNASTGLDLTGTGTVGVKCTPGNGSSIAIASSANNSGNQRRMAGPGGAFLNYALYSDSGFTTAWGDGSNGASALTVTGATNASERTYTVYGVVPKGQDINVGSYSDSVNVTVNF